jgi:short-subunit dehydrogenase
MKRKKKINFKSISIEKINIYLSKLKKYFININYIGAINIAYNVKNHLEKTKGMLINFASSSYTRGCANYALYSSSKAAVVNLTQALSEEWQNIKINCISPERTLTPMRIKNFGIEPPETLLDPLIVAEKTLKISLSSVSEMVIDIRK